MRTDRRVLARVRSGEDSESLAVDESAASEVVAFVLVTAIVIVAIVGIVLAAGPQLAGEQDRVEISQAEQALTQFDSEAYRVATESAGARTVDLGLRGASGTLDVENDSGQITVEYKENLFETDRQQIVNTSLGALVYENDDTTVAYQGGGVWRRDANGSTMVSPPEISYDGSTLTLPVVTTERQGSVHSEVRISPSNPSTQRFPNASADSLNLTNKVNTGTLWITIESQYYRAWGQFFEDETDAIVDYPGGQRVVVIFFGSSFNITPDAGIIATSGPGEIRVEGEGSYIDSYNSSVGPYSETESQQGIVRSAGNIDLFGGATIQGEAESDSGILLDGNSEITGDACGKSFDVGGDATIGGNTSSDCTVPTIPALDTFIERKSNILSAENDNDADPHIDSEQLVFEDGVAELGPGQYYLEDIDMQNNETLVVDAAAGDVDILVEDYVRLDQGHIEVTGNNSDGVVQFFVASEEGSGQTVPGTGGEPADHFYVDGDSQISVNNDRSARFQVLAPERFTGAIRASGSDEPQVTGTILAPTLGEGQSQFIVRDAEIFGAVVTGNLTAENNAEVHFDRGTLDVDVPLPEDALLDFLYATEHSIQVDTPS